MVTQEKINDVGYPYKLFFYDCIWEEDRIIYPASNCNAICETNITTGETIVIAKAEEEKERLLFHGIYKWKEYLILPGRYARCAISLYNLEKGEWSYINIDENKREWLDFRETDVFEYNGYLYAFTSKLIVLKINIENKSIEYIFYPDINPNQDIKGENIIIDNMIYIPIRHNNKIYKFDLRTEQWDIITVNTGLKGIDTLCFDGKLFWMTGIGQMICAWDEKKNVSMYFNTFPFKFKKLVNRKEEEGFWFSTSITYGNSIYFIPCDANMVIEFDIENGEANEFYIEDEWEEKEDIRIGRFSAIKYMGAKKKDNILMMLSNKNKNLIFINMASKEIIKTELKLSTKEGIAKLISSMTIMHEGVVNLHSWLKYGGAFGTEFKIKSVNQEETIGRKIFSYQ